MENQAGDEIGVTQEHVDHGEWLTYFKCKEEGFK